MKKIRLVILNAALLLITAPAVAQQKITMYISHMNGPDEFINERFKLLFMEELSKLKNIELVNSKDNAQWILEGMGRLDIRQQSGIAGSANQTGAVISGSAGDAPNALISIKVSESKTGRIVFVGNKSQIGGGKGVTHSAVSNLVKDMRKQLKLK